MNGKQIGLAVALFGFSALTAVGVYVHGYVGFFDALLSTTAGITAFVDLLIALTLILVWMVRDARERGISPVPYVALTLGFGSVGPLLYLIVREGRVARGHAGLAKAAA